MEFDLPKGSSSIIKVIGVGGGGSNAVNYMYNLGIKGVDFLVCNTDRQALDISPVPLKVQLGPSLTEGRGAGAIPEIGRNAAIENVEELRQLLSKDTKMVFVTAGMGGGTGTGAAPVIAQIAKEMNILTVGIVTVPFGFEGRRRRQQAEEGLEELRQSVDTLLVINNDRLREIGGNLTMSKAFAMADDVLATAAKGIAEVISVTGIINVDFNDVNTVMRNSGVAIMGSATAEGEDRAIKAVKAALNSPLLNDNQIVGAKHVLLNITYGDIELSMDEMGEITDYIQEASGYTAEVIFGHGYESTLGDKVGITLVATGFHADPVTGFEKAPEKVVRPLEEEPKKEIVTPLTSPTQQVASATAEPFLKPQEPVVEPVQQQMFTTPTPPVQEITPVQEVKEEPAVEINSVDLEMEWEVVTPVEKVTPVEPVKTVLTLDDEPTNTVAPSIAPQQETRSLISNEELQRRNRERVEKIQSLNRKIKSSEGLKELENEPAINRRNINLDFSKPSEKENTSRFGITNDREGGLRTNNSFLHDNVD